MRTYLALLTGLCVAACTRTAEPAREATASVPGADHLSADVPQAAAGAWREPIRLPFPGMTGNAEFQYVFSEALPSGGRVTYQRWRGLPDHPGPPIVQVSVRSAQFAGVAGATPVYITDDGAQRVFRRGPAADPYQANLVFTGSTDAEVDSVLARTEVDLSPPLGTELPDAVDVCVGTRGALTRRRAVPIRAGVYNPARPIQGEHLNWMAEGVGCVTYPGISSQVRCEGQALPWVARTVCQR